MEVADAGEALAEAHPTGASEMDPNPHRLALAAVGAPELAHPVAERGAGILAGLVCDVDRHGRMLPAPVHPGNRPIRPTRTGTKVTGPHTAEPDARTRRIFGAC